MTSPLRFLSLVALAAVLLCAGCGGENGALSPETDDSGYRDAKQLENQGRMDEALATYLKVIARRGEDGAPESHLDAGQIYLGYLKDPIYAIYHFRKYLDLEPNSKQAQLVRGQIEAAKREYARTIPGQPTDATSRVELQDDGDSLRRENQELKAEVAAMRAGATPGAITRSTTDLSTSDQPAPSEAIPAAADSSPIKLAPMDQPPVQVVAQGDQPAAPTSVPTRPAAKPTAPASGRVHTVVKGDTFSSLAQKYYGSRSKYRDIMAANPGVTTLKLGTQIRLP
jgi:LysM repeat protein